MSSQEVIRGWKGQRWKRLPDPRDRCKHCTIQIDEGFWTHNRWRHLCNMDEPWEDMMGEALAADARRLARANGVAADKNQLLDRIAAKLQAAVEESLKRPLVLLDTSNQSKRSRQKWLLVLRCGALFRVSSKYHKNHWRQFAQTCYFPTRRRTPLDRRWREVVGIVAREHVQRGFDDPAQTIQFVSPESWGFVRYGDSYQWNPSAVQEWDAARMACPQQDDFFQER